MPSALGTTRATRVTRYLLLLLAPCVALAQDAHEALGASVDPSLKGVHPLVAIERAHPAALKPSLMGVHPRVFFTASELIELQHRIQTTHAALWERAQRTGLALTTEPPPPPAELRRAQNNVAMAIAEAALAYKLTNDPRYLAAAKKFMDAACTYDVWGYRTNKPNIDLAAGHLLYGMGMGYDMLYHDLTDAERARYRAKLTLQARILYKSYDLKPGLKITYSQNHLFIPAAGLGVVAYALYDEVPEAKLWAARVRAIYDRVLATYSPDGYYYEGFEYWVFATPWIVHYLDALAHSTGEDLYDQPGLRLADRYLANVMLPGGKDVFDFADTFEGANTRSGHGEEFERTHPGGNLHSNYILLYRLAQRFRDPEIQGVADWLASQGQVNFEDFWAVAWYDPTIKPASMDKFPTSHYFPDHEAFFWRSGWDANATAVAVKSGPPEGHHTAALVHKFPEWRLEEGHAHPDAASFILYAQGRYLTGDSGYSGIPLTANHNTLMIDGHGQGREGEGHNAFQGEPYDRLNKIRLSAVHASEEGFSVTADATAAYEPELGLKEFKRKFVLKDHELTITDTIKTDSPHTDAILFHFDGGAVSPGLTIKSIAPAGASEKMSPNTVIAAGPPGAVDKGPHEIRGSTLTITAPSAEATVTFETELRWSALPPTR